MTLSQYPQPPPGTGRGLQQADKRARAASADSKGPRLVVGPDTAFPVETAVCPKPGGNSEEALY